MTLGGDDMAYPRVEDFMAACREINLTATDGEEESTSPQPRSVKRQIQKSISHRDNKYCVKVWSTANNNIDDMISFTMDL